MLGLKLNHVSKRGHKMLLNTLFNPGFNVWIIRMVSIEKYIDE